MKRVIIVLIILILLPLGLKLRGQDFGAGQSLFSDIKAHKVGDILTVLIVEDNQARSKVETKTNKKTESSTAGGPGIGSLDFIPMFSAEGYNDTKFDGKGENLRQGAIRGKMSVTVVEVRQNGDLVIQGSRVIGISGDKETLTLSGVVRQKDIRSDNTIESYMIADAEVVYTGKGATNVGARPGLVTRILNWIF
jgi:flagellar L-ring protein precursor FlgH